LVLTHFYAEAFRWWVVWLRPKANWVQVRDVFNATALGSYLLPFKLGLPLRLLMISRYAGLSHLSTTGTMALDSATSLVIWSAFGLALGGHVAFSTVPIVPVLVSAIAGVLVVGAALTFWAGHRLAAVMEKLRAL